MLSSYGKPCTALEGIQLVDNREDSQKENVGKQLKGNQPHNMYGSKLYREISLDRKFKKLLDVHQSLSDVRLSYPAEKLKKRFSQVV